MTGLVLLTAGTVLTCAAGYILRGRKTVHGRKILGGASAALLGLIVLALFLTLSPNLSAAAQAGAESTGSGLGFLGASLATGLACLGAGIAVAVVGAAALGVVGEKPELLGTTLIYLGLAEGIAIYGVIVSLLILGKL